MSPQDGATGVSRNATVKVTFSEPMNPNTVNTSTFRLEDYYHSIPATVSQDPTDTTRRTFLLDPYGSDPGRLRSLTRYKVTVTTGVRDRDGLSLRSDKVWYFTTGSS